MKVLGAVSLFIMVLFYSPPPHLQRHQTWRDHEFTHRVSTEVLGVTSANLPCERSV